MANQDILNYVKQQLAAGYDAAAIREALVSYGYPVREAEDAIEAVIKPKAAAPALKKAEDILKEHKKINGEEAKFAHEELTIVALLRMWFLSLSMPTISASNFLSHQCVGDRF